MSNLREEKIKAQIKSERQQFIELDRQMQNFTKANMNVKGYEETKVERGFCVAQINHLYKQLHPNASHDGKCSYCGGILASVTDKNNEQIMRCVACDRITTDL